MSTSDVSPGERVKTARCTDDLLIVDLSETPQQRANWKLVGGGYGIHWPDVDEDLSTDGLLRGAPAPRASATAQG